MHDVHITLTRGGDLKGRLYIICVLFIGLMSAQILASVHVYTANLSLQRSTVAIIQAGYLAVPNAHVAANLKSVLKAIAGGVFFTFSLGAGLTMLTFCGAWVWDRVFSRSPKATRVFIGLWVIGLALFNISEFNVAALAYLIFVPAATWAAAAHWMPPRIRSEPLTLSAVPVISFVVLVLFWSVELDHNVFINIRDHLLLSNSIGQKISDFYYTYSLYPAETFKTLEQKQIRTYRAEKILDSSLENRLEHALRSNDYLLMNKIEKVDLHIETGQNEALLILKNNKKTLWTLPADDFIKDPGHALRVFSKKCDQNSLFRKLIYLSLLLGLPLILYTIAFSMVSFIVQLFFPFWVSVALSAFLCLVIGIVVFIPVKAGTMQTDGEVGLNSSFSSGTYPIRLAMLKRVCRDQIEITNMEGYEGLIRSRHVAERYWLAKSLGYSKKPTTRIMLHTLLRDPSVIVVCQALWALGKRGKREDIRTIIKKITSSINWYEQFYGYRALRSLGWVQPKLQPRSS